MTGVRRVVGSVAFYPVTLTYLAAVLVATAVVGGALRLDVGLILLGLFAVLVILWSMRREVGKVHKLVNSKHDALLTRVDQLVDALTAAGVSIPQDKAGVDRERKPR